MEEEKTLSQKELDEIDRIAQESGLIPGWFSDRMMVDEWYYAFLLKDGSIVHISKINEIYRDEKKDLWIDAKLLESLPHHKVCGYKTFCNTQSTRLDVSIRADAIMMAFETADT